MYIERVPNRRSKPTILLRQAWREGKKVRKRTIANLSAWPEKKIQAMRLLLKGETMVPATHAVAIEESLPYGHIRTVLKAIQSLELERVISSRPSQYRNLVVAMIVQRIIVPDMPAGPQPLNSWTMASLVHELDLKNTGPGQYRDALEWLGNKQAAVERRLLSRHAAEDSVLYYAVFPHNHDMHGHTCILCNTGNQNPSDSYGLLLDEDARPLGIDVIPGSCNDSSLVDLLQARRKRLEINHIIITANHGDLNPGFISRINTCEGFSWVCVLKPGRMKQSNHTDAVELHILDDGSEVIQSPDSPDRRYLVFKNPEMNRGSISDGLCMLSTSNHDNGISAEKLRISCNILNQTEYAFRDIDHVVCQSSGHALLCMLAYYVEQHIRRALTPVLTRTERELYEMSSDENSSGIHSAHENKVHDTPEKSDTASVGYTFSDLMVHLSTQCRNRCRLNSKCGSPSFYILTEPTPLQQQVLTLIESLHPRADPEFPAAATQEPGSTSTSFRESNPGFWCSEPKRVIQR